VVGATSSEGFTSLAAVQSRYNLTTLHVYPSFVRQYISTLQTKRTSYATTGGVTDSQCCKINHVDTADKYGPTAVQLRRDMTDIPGMHNVW